MVYTTTSEDGIRVDENPADRLHRIAGQKRDDFIAIPIQDAVVDALYEDDQLRTLIDATILARTIDTDRSAAGPTCPVHPGVSTAVLLLDRLVSRRATEVVGEECAAILRGEGHVEVDGSDMTGIQDLFDVMYEAREWLDDYEADIWYLRLEFPRNPWHIDKEYPT